MQGKLKVCSYNHRRKQAKDILRGSHKRQRTQKITMTDEDCARMAVFLKYEKENKQK